MILSCNPTTMDSNNNEIKQETEKSPTISTVDSANIDQESLLDNSFCEKDISGIFDNAKCFQLSETLRADFNGDGYQDEARFRLVGRNNTIHIYHGQSGEVREYGPDNPLVGIGGDFDWVDYWGVLYDSTSFEIVISDGEVIGDTLVRFSVPSIFLRQSELGGGLISYRNDDYEWIHQAD